MSIAADLRGLAAMRPADVALTAEALRELLRARGQREGPELKRALAERPPARAGRAEGDPLRVARSVRRAGRLFPGGGNCLVQSLALDRMLRGRGHPAEVRIGVKRESGALAAHAWVEYEGVALLEAGLDEFSTLSQATQPRLRFAGEVIETELDLPGAQPAPGAEPTLRLDVARGPGEEGWEQRAEATTTDGSPLWTLSERDGAYLLRLSGSSEIELDLPRAHATVRPEPGVALETAVQDFLGSGLAFAGALRGRVVLHASAVATEAGAVGFVGRSGAGKSTAAGWLAARDAELLAEDLLVLEPAGNGFVALPGSSALKLDRAGVLQGAGADPVPRSPHKGWARAAAAAEPVPLRALFLLERDGDGAGAEPVRGSAAFAALMGHVTVAGLMRPETLGGSLQTDQADLVMRLAGAATVARLRYPSGPEGLDEVARLVESQLAAAAGSA
ncbi:MAG TPA: lasso peptide biosynthesis B2 protein [Thermoanaerobaculia bacterium]|nr:lasso peptide biosynthesis B2 protein [Thermoanaerobaculia bacterium]